MQNKVYSPIDGNAYVSNNEINKGAFRRYYGIHMSFNIYCGADFPENDNIKDLERQKQVDFWDCMNACAEHNQQRPPDEPKFSDNSTLCTGVSYLDGYCWLKANLVSTASQTTRRADSAVLLFG